MSLVGDYNLALVQVIVGNFRVTGWSADDAVSVAPMTAEIIETEASADGTHVSSSKINDPRYEATLTVRRNTAAYKLLMARMVAQMEEADAGAVSPLAFSISDPISGDKVVDGNARFTTKPELSFSKSQGDVEIKLLLPNPRITYGANITVT